MLNIDQKCASVSIVGIANSVELFKGEMQVNSNNKSKSFDQSKFLLDNEMKLLFKPYTRDQLASILMNLYIDHLKHRGLESLTTTLINPKAFQLTSAKIDKLSGDLRVCFEIVRATI